MKDQLKENGNVLAIESAVAGGSVALIRDDGSNIVRHEGNESSRAEKIMSAIDDVLREADLTPGDLNLIAVSAGPGSYSGIRIGLSTALGLSDALDIPCVSVSVLAAMAEATPMLGALIAAVPVGKNDIAWQRFKDREPLENPVLSSSAGFIHELSLNSDLALFLQSDLFECIADQLSTERDKVDAGRGLAEFIGRFALKTEANGLAQPLYLRNKDSTRPGVF